MVISNINTEEWKGYFRETCKSQNRNPISPTPKFTLGIVQIITKASQLYLVSTCLVQ